MRHHEGERILQRRAGVTRPNWGSAGVSAEIPPIAAEFLSRQCMVLAGAADTYGAVWATALTGPAGFARVAGDRTVVVDALPGPGDPLDGAFAAERDVGMLAIEPQTRRRLRINGRARRVGRGLRIHPEQVYANCPKYIQSRHLLREDDAVARPPWAARELTVAQQRWIARADTFFVATYAPGHGADASHRGGNPGFVHIHGPRRLLWPDYAGNAMFMTLGNLELNPACGLLFLDWEHGHTLQLTGQARIDWDPDRAAAIPGAQRLIHFHIDHVIQTNHAHQLRWQLGDYFRHNPPVAEDMRDQFDEEREGER